MIPSYVISLDEIPLTVNGKVDKHALPDVDLSSLHTEYVAPRTENEKLIVDAFEKVFKQENIGIHDDFTRLGGDSLTAIKINSLLPTNIDVSIILKHRTPYNIAQYISGNKSETGFVLAKKGTENRNMFLIPPLAGVSFIFLDLINNIDFKGNIYVIDDYKYDLSLDEIRNLSNNKLLDYYYDSIKDLFQNEDIIVGYSLGCIYASLIIEHLEKEKTVSKCILIDGPLNFVQNNKQSKEELIANFKKQYSNKFNLEKYSDDFKEKLIEISSINSVWNYHTPKINCPILFLSTSGFKDGLNNISDNYELICIDSTHEEIIAKDVGKIAKYFSTL